MMANLLDKKLANEANMELRNEFAAAYLATNYYVRNYKDAADLEPGPASKSDTVEVPVENLVRLQLFYHKMLPIWLEMLDRCARLIQIIESEEVVSRETVDAFAQDLDWQIRCSKFVEKLHQSCSNDIAEYANNDFGTSTKVQTGHIRRGQLSKEESAEIVNAAVELFNNNRGLLKEGIDAEDLRAVLVGQPDPGLRYDPSRLRKFRDFAATQHAMWKRNIQECRSLLSREQDFDALFPGNRERLLLDLEGQEMRLRCQMRWHDNWKRGMDSYDDLAESGTGFRVIPIIVATVLAAFVLNQVLAYRRRDQVADVVESEEVAHGLDDE